MNKTYYHVVTERPMTLGQEIIFDENHHSGVYERVYNLLDKVDDEIIYIFNPLVFCLYW